MDGSSPRDHLIPSRKAKLSAADQLTIDSSRAGYDNAPNASTDQSEVYWSALEHDERMPLSIHIGPGQWRKATEAELQQFLLRNPYIAADVAPAVLRRVMAEHDGEFLALVAERRRVQRRFRNWRDSEERDRHIKAALEENLRKLCETPVCTDAGAAIRLNLLFDATWPSHDQFTPSQTRQLLWPALVWLRHSSSNNEPAARRTIDTAGVAAELRSYGREGQSG